MRLGGELSGARAGLFVVLVGAGYALIIPGQLATLHLDEALIWAALNLGRPGRWLLNLTWSGLPPGAFLAVGLILIGSGLIAAAIALVSAPAPVPNRTDEHPAPPTSALLPARLSLSLATALAAATLYICRLPEPSNVAVATWGASLFCGLTAFAWLDRAVATRMGWPFDGSREIAIITLLATLSMAVVTHDLASWRWSGTPDETHFFGVAKAIAEGTAQRFLFSERGVFEVHPTLSSAYQSAFMLLFGASGWAWRLSSAMALVAALPPFYLLARWLWNTRVAVIATALFGTTPAAVGFAHLGYNNSQIYPVVVGALALLVWAHRCRSAVGYYLAGCVAGLGFYTYYPARLAPLLLILLGLCLGALPLRRSGRNRTMALVTGLLLTVVPSAAHPADSLARMFQFTSLTGGGSVRVTDLASAWELVASSSIWTLVNQSFLALLYSVYFISPHHFQWPPVVDVVSGPLVLVGLWLCVGAYGHANARFLALAFVVSVVIVGGTSHYFRPPLTRLLFLSPFAALLAAVALDRFATSLARTTRVERLGAGVVTVLTVAAVGWAIVSLQYNVRYLYHGYGDGTTAELVRLARQQPDGTRVIYVQRKDTSMWSVDGVFDQYGMRERLAYFQGLTNEAKEALQTTTPPLFAALNLADAAEIRTVEEILRRRFPEAQWQASDPDRTWNLRYLAVR